MTATMDSMGKQLGKSQEGKHIHKSDIWVVLYTQQHTGCSTSLPPLRKAGLFGIPLSNLSPFRARALLAFSEQNKEGRKEEKREQGCG